MKGGAAQVKLPMAVGRLSPGLTMIRPLLVIVL